MEGKSLADLRRARPVDDAAFQKAYRSIQLELPLAALRQEIGITQAEMAKRLSVTQAAISKLEGRGDFLCSTLFRYIEKIGAELEVKVRLRDKKFDLLPKKCGADLFFSLSECADAVDAVVNTVSAKSPRPGSKVVYFKDFAPTPARRKKASHALSWPEQSLRQSDMADVLLNISEKYEKQPATA